MTPKEYLSQYKSLSDEIDRLLEEQEHWKALATRVSPGQSGGGHGSGNPDGKIPLAVEKIFETEEKINIRVDELSRLREEISSMIDRLPGGNHREVLYRRYILCQTFERIADRMDYSYMQICRIHGQSLQEFEKCYRMLYSTRGIL